MSHYTFSWFTKCKAPVLKRRPWWNVFGRDTIELREQWERISIHNIPKREATLLYDASAGRWRSPLGTLLVRMMSNPLSIQLEGDGVPTPYVATTPDEAQEQVRRLHATTDALIWAREFNAVHKELHGFEHDEGWLVGWFANAIEVGRDAGKAAHPVIDQKVGEAADYIENFCVSFGPEDGLHLSRDTWERLRQAIIRVMPVVRMRRR